MPDRRLDPRELLRRPARQGSLNVMRIKTVLGILAMLSMAGAACSSKNDEPGSSSSSGGEKIKQKADEAGDTVDEAAEDTGDKVEEATE
jgi:hypothetical protein